jgi:YebC/PmpR family DNA-binding regulatory protein
MSGHSKWATIKRKKGKADAERGKVFTRHIKEITIAAREGGGDPEGNPRLRTAIASAKASNMPQANIDRAILKGTGQLPGVIYESATFEGYGPNGVAIFLEVMTDNRKRTVADLRHIFSKYGGNLGESGCVAWMFERKGVITIDRDAIQEDALMEIALEAGAEDINGDSGSWEVTTPPEAIDDVRSALEQRDIPMVAAEVTMIAKDSVRLTKENQASSMLKMYELLEEHDDVQKVYSNFDIDEELLEKLA